jgi:hypothetical protein
MGEWGDGVMGDVAARPFELRSNEGCRQNGAAVYRFVHRFTVPVPTSWWVLGLHSGSDPWRCQRSVRGVKSRNALGKENAALLRRWVPVLARNVQARLGGTAGQHVFIDPDNRRAAAQ